MAGVSNAQYLSSLFPYCFRSKTVYTSRLSLVFLIHLADPESWPVVIIIFGYTYCPSVRPHFSKYSKTKHVSSKNNVDDWRYCGSDRVDHWWHMSCCPLFFLVYQWEKFFASIFCTIMMLIQRYNKEKLLP